NAYDATAPWASVQKGHWLSFDTNAANSSRSGSLQSDGPFITSWKYAETGSPNSSGRKRSASEMSETYPSRSRSSAIRAAISGVWRSSTRIDRLVRVPAPGVRGGERDRQHRLVQRVRVEVVDVRVCDLPRAVTHLLEQRRHVADRPCGLADRAPELVSPRGAGGGRTGGCRHVSSIHAHAACPAGRVRGTPCRRRAPSPRRPRRC